MSLRILIANPDPKQRAHLVALCESLGCRVFEAATARECLAGARASAPQIVMLSAELGTDQTLTALGEVCPSAARLLLLESGDKLPTRKYLQAGATDLLPASPSLRELELALARVEQRRSLVRGRDQLERELEGLRGSTLVGRSRPLLRVHDQIQRVASTPRTTVLVTGEPGVGKELVARNIHRSSARAQRPFVCVPCAGEKPGQVETLLYGCLSPQPAAPAAKPLEGALASAAGGTVFLSSIDSLGPDLQVRVLELLQDRTWRATPDGEEQTADVRVIASTSEDLARLVAEGRFREDLLYRLNVLSIDVPPLRERREDVPLLTELFLERIGRDMGRSGRSLAPEALLALAAQPWPGNVRQLRNALERGLIAASGRVITQADLGLNGASELPASPEELAPAGQDFRLRHMEEVLIRRALLSTNGNRSATARLLGVNRTTLYNKLRTYEIDD